MTTGQSGPSSSATEQWYFRIDGTLYGPSTRADLERFLRPPRLCSVLEVMCTTRDGVWFTIAKHETIDKVLEKAGVPLEPVVDTVEAVRPKVAAPKVVERAPREPSRIGESLSSLLQSGAWLTAFLAAHKLALAAVLVIVAGNVVALVASQQPSKSDSEILAIYQNLWKQVRTYQDEPPAAEVWQSFAAAGRAELEPIVQGLQKTASVRQPLQQNLLFCGRDHLLVLLKSEKPPAENSPHRRVVDRYLRLTTDSVERR